MELDELKAGWAELERRLERVEARVTDTDRRAGVRAELRPLVAGQAIQVVVGVLMAMAAGAFWIGHRHEPNLLVSGLLLHAYAIAAIVAAARNLFLVSRVNEGAPVLDLQRRVVALRAWRIREGRWFGVAGCFMWVPMLVCGFGTTGIDIVTARPGYVALNLLAGLVCLGVFIVVSRRGGKPGGASVRRAEERLAEIARFEDV